MFGAICVHMYVCMVCVYIREYMCVCQCVCMCSMTGGAIVLHQNIAISYSHIKNKGENVLIKLPALCPAAIIPPELVSVIHTLLLYDSE